MPELTEKEKSLRGDLYWAFTPDLIAERERCSHACHRFNTAGEVPRRRLVELWKDITHDTAPLPAADDSQLLMYPWVEPPFKADYGTNIHVGHDVFINFSCTILDTCRVSIGDRCLLGPNVSLYSGSHPLDPVVRNGTRGPEYGAEIHIEDDCWIGGAVIILPGVRIGRGATVGAGSVVTKSVPAFHVAAGNPARVIKKIETTMDPDRDSKSVKPDIEGAEVVMAKADKS